MHRSIVFVSILLITAICAGCATTSMLPQKSSGVVFEGGEEGHVGWAKFREEAVFNGVKKRDGLLAAKAGLANADFVLKRVDNTEGIVFGEHGMTWLDWNIIAGVYVKESNNDLLVLVIVEGSKDLGFAGDDTQEAWTGKIIKGMRDYLGKRQN
jgi:hypothetical protein